MNSSKRSSNSSKNNTNRNRNREASTSRHLPDDADTFLNNLPLIKQAENSRLLPRYSAILSRTQDDGVNMDDLDQLQLDLEELISTCAVRNRLLRTEIDLIERGGSNNNNGNLDDRRDRKGKSNDRGSLKRKRTDDNRTSKYHRDLRLASSLQTTTTSGLNNGGLTTSLSTTTPTTRPLKKHYTIPTTLITDPTLRNDLPKINLPKNDTSDKFWASVEPYCSPITQTHSLFLDKLIDECSQDIEIKIPELGDYYANEWNDTVLNDEQEMGANGKNSSGGDSNGSNSLKRNGLNAMIDTFSNPKTQRLLAVLIEERVMTSFPGVTGKLKPSDLSILKSAAGGRSAICMDRRLKKDLVEQGILSVDDLAKNQQDDEILQEIKKCQQELTTINEYNVDELNRLKQIVKKDMKRQEIKQQLDKVDTQILELYNKILITKQKTIQHQSDIDLDKNGFTKILKEFEGQTALLLKQQYQLQKELNELNLV